MALATTAEDGTPRIAPLFYVVDGALQLYWFSKASTEHSGNLRRNPAAAVTVYSETLRWQEIRGVQMRGRVTEVHARGLRQEIGEAFRARFGLGLEFDAMLEQHTLYCFIPEWLRWVDNTRGFGYQEEHLFP